ncbi:hypothetical protein ACG5V6_27310, partial [Streptomyces chitinivorans]
MTIFATALERGARRTRRAAARLTRPDGHGRGALVAFGALAAADRGVVADSGQLVAAVGDEGAVAGGADGDPAVLAARDLDDLL